MQNFRKRPTYEELINDIVVEQPKIKYPDRTATILRNSHYLSQFDGNLLDLEEQEKNIDKQKLKEIEIRKIASEKKTTAGLLRTSRKSISIQTGGIRNTESSSSGVQTETYRPTTTTGDTQTDPPVETETQTERPKTRQAPTDTRTQIFDIAPDDMPDTAMEDAEAAEEEEKERVKRRERNIKKLVSTNLGETVDELPFLRSSAASSSTDVLLTEDTKRKRGRPKNIAINEPPKGDTGGEDTKKRGRKKQQDSVPMIVETIVEDPKRKNIIEDTGGETTKKRGRKTNAEKEKRKAEGNEPPKKKQNKQEKELMRIQDAIDKAAAKEAVREAKAAAKEADREETAAEKEAAKARKEHGVEKTEGKDKNLWKKQTLAFIKLQAELRGHRFTDTETKGDTTVQGVKTKIKKFKKPDYLKVLLNILKL